MSKGFSHLVASSVAAAAFSFVCLPAVHADTTAVVTPTSLQGWHSIDVTGGGSVVITGDAPRSGNGSLEFNSPGSNGKATYQLGGNAFTNNFGTLSNLTTLGYDFNRSGSSTAADFQMPSLRLLIRDGFQTGVLIYEPVYNGRPTTTNTWMSSGNIVSNDGNFWLRANSANFYGSPNGQTLTTWRSGATVVSDTGTRTSPSFSASTIIYGFELGIGSGWAGTYEGFADNFRVGFGTGSVTTYNFETAASAAPVPEPGSVAVTATMLCGVAGLVLKSRRRKSTQA
ncbi:MAG: hypothetical protein V4671_16450 [Armatimonadota bacterium]